MLAPFEAYHVGKATSLAEAIAAAETAGLDAATLRTEWRAAFTLASSFLRAHGLISEPPRAPVADAAAWAERSRRVARPLEGEADACFELGATAGQALGGTQLLALGADPAGRPLLARAAERVGELEADDRLRPRMRELARRVRALTAELRGDEGIPELAGDVARRLAAELVHPELHAAFQTPTPPAPAGGPSAEEEALAARIAAHPDDPAYDLARDEELRRAFATAVEPRDPARAELVRVQLDLHHDRRLAVTLPDAGQLLRREGQLLAAHAARWAAPLAGLVAGSRFRRGFVGEVTMTGPAFAARARDVYALAPVTIVRLRGGLSGAVLASPHLARLRALDLATQPLGEAEVAALVESTHARQLVWLDLSGCGLSVAAVRRLPELPALRQVLLGGDAHDPGDRITQTDDSGRPTGWERTALGRELEERHGPLPWLHPWQWPRWPMDPEALLSLG
jgi:hypothetical protein